ncbi:hypothetical protein [Nocardioides sp. J54]|uniref:hypothetical protein n=1 Tax=Nocardioides sp. J54 TaxID=935866 RepID=UPI0004915429|nr:hypothetical protein [Nocardioides sp. J54]
MHERGAQIKPAYPADWIEWGFRPGDPALVAAVPDDDGETALIRLDQFAPTGHREREFVTALLNIAHRLLAESEPTSLTSGAKA